MTSALGMLAVALALGADDPHDAVRREHSRLNGTWTLVAVREKLAPDDVFLKGDGLGLEAVRRHDVSGVECVFADGRLSIRGRRGQVRQFLGADRFHYEIDPASVPRGITLTPLGDELPADARRAFGAIYLLDGELWICDHGGNIEPPKDFSMDVGIAYPKRIFVLRRVEETAGR